MLITALSLFASLPTALAHKPSFTADGGGTAEEPHAVEDIDVSIVVYHEVTCDHPVLWLELEADAGDELYVQLGVPVIDRLANYAPSVALIGPGLPQADLPFDVPEGYGAIRYDTDGVEPTDFFEPFSGTDSWIYLEETVPLESAGTWYVAAWDPEGWTGKLWVATGTVEDFGQDDFDNMLDWLDQTRTFHEVEGYGPAEAPEDSYCDPDTALDADSADGAPAGCSSAPAAPPVGGLAAAALALLALGAVRRRVPLAAPAAPRR